MAEDNSNQSDVWKKYYNSTLILFNMINSVNLQSREISVFKSKEEMMAHPNWRSQRIPSLHIRHINDLKKLMLEFDVILNQRTLYASTSTINWETVRWTDYSKGYVDWKAVGDRWAEEYDKAIYRQDFILDFDYSLKPEENQNLKHSYFEVKQVVDFFREQNIPFSVNFSGRKGWHIRILHNLIDASYPKSKKTVSRTLRFEEKYVKVANALEKMFDLHCLDKSTLFRRQPCRIPFSLHSSGQVCLPLFDWEFNDFFKLYEQGYFNPENVMKLNLYDKELYKEYKGCNRLPMFEGDPKNISKLFESLVKYS